MPEILYRHRARNRGDVLNRCGLFFDASAANSRHSDIRAAGLSLVHLAVLKTTRNTLAHHCRALRASKVVTYKYRLGKTPLAELLQRADTVSASNPLVLRRVTARDGTVYPLRIEITVVVKHTARTAAVFIHELQWLESLFGQGTCDRQAVEAFSESFHHLVSTHHRKPPHLRTEVDNRINRVLDHLVDWRRFEIENPVDQPLWGRIGKRDDKGNLRIWWVSGPRGEADIESVILASDVVEEFDAIGEDHWFFGSGRVFPDRIAWTSRPVEIPDPHDEAAIKAAWDLIPSQVMSDFAAWPLKK